MFAQKNRQIRNGCEYIFYVLNHKYENSILEKKRQIFIRISQIQRSRAFNPRDFPFFQNLEIKYPGIHIHRFSKIPDLGKNIQIGTIPKSRDKKLKIKKILNLKVKKSDHSKKFQFCSNTLSQISGIKIPKNKPFFRDRRFLNLIPRISPV